MQGERLGKQNLASKATTKLAVSRMALAEAAEFSNTNLILMDLAGKLAETSLETERKIQVKSQEERQALKWLQSVDLVEDGFLSSLATTAITKISDPEPITTTCTAFGKRELLLKQGWVSVSGRLASASQQKLNAVQCLLYYDLLLTKYNQVCVQEQARMFSHSQPQQFYKTLEVAFQVALDKNKAGSSSQMNTSWSSVKSNYSILLFAVDLPEKKQSMCLQVG